MDSNLYSRRMFLKLMGASTVLLALPSIDYSYGKKYAANLGIQLYTIRKEIEKDFESTMKKIAEIGFMGVETYALPANISLQQAAKTFKETGLKVLGMHTELPVGDQRDHILKMADAYNCKRVIFAGWPEGEKYKDKDAMKHTAELYNEAAVFLRQRGLSFGLHNHWWEFESHDGIYPFYYLLEHLDHEIFFEIDTYWTKAGGQDPAKVVKDFGKRAPLLHIKDGPAVKGDRANDQAPAGKGTMDFSSIVKAGGKNIEWMIVEFDDYSGNIFDGIRESYEYLTQKGFARGRKS